MWKTTYRIGGKSIAIAVVVASIANCLVQFVYSYLIMCVCGLVYMTSLKKM
jgi:hypothetical protein